MFAPWKGVRSYTVSRGFLSLVTESSGSLHDAERNSSSRWWGSSPQHGTTWLSLPFCSWAGPCLTCAALPIPQFTQNDYPQSGNCSSFWRHDMSPAVKVCWKSSGGGILRFWFKCSLWDTQQHSRGLPGRGVWEKKVITNLAAKKLNRTCRPWIWSLPLFPTEKRQQWQPGDRNQYTAREGEFRLWEEEKL